MSSVVFAFALLFQSDYGGTEQFAQNAGQYMANVIGMSALIEENELNVITTELTKQRRALEEREKALEEREIDARASDTVLFGSISDFILSGALLLLLLLIVMNYLFDYIRARAQLRTYAKVA